MPNWMVEVIKLGFHGVAVVLTFLAYKLLKKVVELYADDDSDQPNVNMKSILSTIQFFMIICVVLAVVGIGAQLADSFRNPKTSLTLNIYPTTEESKEYISMINVKHCNQSLELQKDEHNPLTISDNDFINVEVTALINEIKTIDDELRTARKASAINSGYSNTDGILSAISD